jgi:hypothetical protein
VLARRAYRRWLTAKGNVFCPSGAAIAQLAERLRKEGWIADGGTKTPTPLDGAWIDNPVRSDLVLGWPAARALLAATHGAPPVDVVLELHRGEDFVYPSANGIGRIETECDCGEDLAFEWDADEVTPPFGAAMGIFTECSECSRTFDPARSEAEILDPATGRTTSVRGGAAYRFALVVKASLPDGPVPAMSAELVATCAAEFNRSFYELGVLA